MWVLAPSEASRSVWPLSSASSARAECRCNPSSRQIRCTACVHAPAISEQAADRPSAVPSAHGDVANARMLCRSLWLPQDQQTRAWFRRWVVAVLPVRDAGAALRNPCNRLQNHNGSAASFRLRSFPRQASLNNGLVELCDGQQSLSEYSRAPAPLSLLWPRWISFLRRAAASVVRGSRDLQGPTTSATGLTLD